MSSTTAGLNPRSFASRIAASFRISPDARAPKASYSHHFSSSFSSVAKSSLRGTMQTSLNCCIVLLHCVNGYMCEFVTLVHKIYHQDMWLPSIDTNWVGVRSDLPSICRTLLHVSSMGFALIYARLNHYWIRSVCAYIYLSESRYFAFFCIHAVLRTNWNTQMLADWWFIKQC